MEGTSETSIHMVLKFNHVPKEPVVFRRNGFLSSTKEISMFRKEVKKNKQKENHFVSRKFSQRLLRSLFTMVLENLRLSP